MITISALYSPQLKRDITLRIYTPPEYDQTKEHYPIIYFFDGQNLFDPADASYGMIWAADKTIEALELPMIIVGLDSEPESRVDEYAPWKFGPEAQTTELKDRGGQGDKTAEFIKETLIPWINQNYRTGGSQMIAGSSLGGVMSLYVGSRYPEEFSYILAMSNAAWLFQDVIEDQLRKIDPANKQRYYIDTGTQESKDEGIDTWYVESNRRLAFVLEQLGVDYKLHIEAEGRHNETAWQRRLPAAINWLINHQWEEV